MKDPIVYLDDFNPEALRRIFAAWPQIVNVLDAAREWAKVDKTPEGQLPTVDAIKKAVREFDDGMDRAFSA